MLSCGTPPSVAFQGFEDRVNAYDNEGASVQHHLEMPELPGCVEATSTPGAL